MQYQHRSETSPDQCFFLNLWNAFQIDSNEGLFQSVEILIFVWTGVFGLDAQVAKCWKMLKDVERVGRSLPQTWNVRYFEILGHAADPTGAKPFLRGRAVSYETDPISNVWSDLTRSFIWMKWIQILMKVLEQYRRWFSRWRLQILLCKCKVWRHHSRSWFVPEMNSFFDIVTKCIKMLQRLENGWNEYRNTEIQSRVCKGCDKPKQFSDFRFFSD